MKILHSVAIDITYKCNYCCKHCYNSSGNVEKINKEMTDEEILKIIDDISNYLPESVCICGGETLLRKDLVYKIGELVKKKFPENTALNIVTNGYYVTDEVAKNLKKSGYYLVQVSLDGANEESHNWIRNNDAAFERAINAIKILKANNLKVSVACAPSKKNYNQIEELINLCKRLGVKLVRFQPLMIMGRANNLIDYMLDEIEYAKLGVLVSKYVDKDNDFTVEWGDPLQHLEYIKVSGSKMMDVTINAYGELMVSPYLPIIIGDLKKHSFVEYMDNDLNNGYSIPAVKKAAGLIDDWESMDLNKKYSILPRIGIDRYINCDLLDIEHNDKEIINQLLEITNKENTY
ncbi:radical SAM protein [Thomasclavelia spiroformis]|uniref:radical SAM protein n=1 Tax=Thomasclavelia spiroformis TaxID=29348 RepID=UPI00399FD56D